MIMKIVNRIMIGLTAATTAAATAALFLAATLGTAKAAEPVLSPRAQSVASDFRHIGDTTPDMLDRSVKTGSPKGLALASELRHTSGKERDALNREVKVGSPRSEANTPATHL